MFIKLCVLRGWSKCHRNQLEETMEGKLPQNNDFINVLLNGYSSYGNQIGLATTFVR